jgi:NACHT domain
MEETSDVRQEEQNYQVMTTQLKQLSLVLWTMSQTREKLAKEYHILKSLLYKVMEIRYTRVADAHAHTFEWIFNKPVPPDEPLLQNNSFIDWLESGRGIFWVTGKAGSGKSTLMKFLGRHPATRHALKLWAGDKATVVASFYFWYAGTELQKSQQGLLQSLLYEVLGQCPDLIPLVLSERWKECSSTRSSPSHWTRAELLEAFAELEKQTLLSTKFCFFVDGLDEYGGDHQEIIKLLQGFTQSEHIKICISSRPWNAFLSAFGSGSCPKLHLEDLTQDDIELYVRDKLEENHLIQKLSETESGQYADLVHEVVYKAKGVFLWVFLVITSLVQSLTNVDQVTDLQRRLHQLPSDLETYFEHILGQIDITYRKQTVRILRTALCAREPLTLMTYVMIDEIEEDPEFALKLGVQPWTQPKIDSKCSDMKLRISARCKDLLDVTKVKPSQAILSNVAIMEGYCAHRSKMPWGPEIDSSEINPRRVICKNGFFEYEVDFLHRTVRDFLQTRDMNDMLLSSVPANFNSNEALCHSFLAQIKTVSLKPDDVYRFGPLSDLIDDLMFYARELEIHEAVTPMKLLDELEYVYKSLVATIPSTVSYSAPIRIEESLREMRESFLGFAVEKGLRLYVAEKLNPVVDGLARRENHGQLITKALRPCFVSKYSINSKLELAEFLWKHLRKKENQEIRAAVGFIMEQIRLQWFWPLNRPHKKTQLDFIAILLGDCAESNGILSGLQWVDFILMAELSWIDTDYEFTKTLSRIVVGFLENGISPNSVYRNRTLWGHFLKMIWGGNLGQSRLALKEWKQHALTAAKSFLDHGADRNYVLSGGLGNEKYSRLEGLAVRDVLRQVFSQEQVAFLLGNT